MLTKKQLIEDAKEVILDYYFCGFDRIEFSINGEYITLKLIMYQQVDEYSFEEDVMVNETHHYKMWPAVIEARMFADKIRDEMSKIEDKHYRATKKLTLPESLKQNNPRVYDKIMSDPKYLYIYDNIYDDELPF